MPETLSIIFTALLLVALFKLFFDDLKDLWATVKKFCWWFFLYGLFDLSPETKETGFKFPFWLAIGAIGGLLLYHNLSK